MSAAALRLTARLSSLVVLLAACSGGSPSHPSTATQVIVVSGDPQFGKSPGGLSDAMVGQVLDAASHPVVSATVNWNIVSGGGTLTASSTTSASSGVTSNTIQLSGSPGTTVVTASVAGGTVSATFHITATTSTSERVTVTTPRIVVIDSGQTTTPGFVAVEDNGTPIPNPGLAFSSSNSFVDTVTAAGVVYGISPGEALIAARAPVIGYVADSVVVIVAAPNGPLLLSDLTRFDYTADTTITVGIRMDMHGSGEKLGAATVYVSWNPAVLIYQSDAPGTDNVPVTVNAGDALTTGSWTLAMASVNGYAGAVELRRITFKVNSAGHSGTFSLFAAEVGGAGTFHNLQPRTVSGTYPVYSR